jgi:hypothetical protein
MRGATKDEQEILDLARQTAERLQLLTARLQAYIDESAAPDSGKRRRSDDKEKP